MLQAQAGVTEGQTIGPKRKGCRPGEVMGPGVAPAAFAFLYQGAKAAGVAAGVGFYIGLSLRCAVRCGQFGVSGFGVVRWGKVVD